MRALQRITATHRRQKITASCAHFLILLSMLNAAASHPRVIIMERIISQIETVYTSSCFEWGANVMGLTCVEFCSTLANAFSVCVLCMSGLRKYFWNDVVDGANDDDDDESRELGCGGIRDGLFTVVCANARSTSSAQLVKFEYISSII